MSEKVIIIGAGLSGSLLAIYLAKRGIEADVYEARSDMRKAEVAAGRSINLALSDRGIAALREVGMDEYMLREAVPMRGRMIHATDGQTKLLPYSGRKGEYINSISRGGLNVALINEAEKHAGVRFYFNEKCVDFDCKSGEAIFQSGKTVKGDTLIATDGAGSAVRSAMLRGGVPRFDFAQTRLEHGYKELHIPPGANGEFQMEKNALHIWARGAFMMIALPNFDGSFTCTLFLAHAGENSFEQILSGNYISRGFTPTHADQNLENADRNLEKTTRNFDKNPRRSATESLLAFFQTNFPDAIRLMPSLTEDFFANPIGNLGTVKCFPWNVGGKSLLLGDSAHAVVPFYGQGMNASFEDCRILNQLIEQRGTDWEKVFDEFTISRKPNTDAIADMAEENFYEMRDAVADPVFQRKRELETRLEQTFPDYFSKYSMVTFREDLPYSIARRKGNAQDELLMEICAKVENVSEIDLTEVLEKTRSL
ncbi:MAG: kynurenine 3-monooxygenase [Acidobacteria bacterium]|jgi:kynurenine 3-monooxygenase|nr:kynurenine 3-monooxygenase [Acidobacteriota bacterium]